MKATMQESKSGAHQDDKHDEEEGRRQDSRCEDAVRVKVVLRGETPPVGGCQAVEPLRKVHQGGCVV